MVSVMGWVNILTYSQYLALNKGLITTLFLRGGRWGGLHRPPWIFKNCKAARGTNIAPIQNKMKCKLNIKMSYLDVLSYDSIEVSQDARASLCTKRNPGCGLEVHLGCGPYYVAAWASQDRLSQKVNYQKNGGCFIGGCFISYNKTQVEP